MEYIIYDNKTGAITQWGTIDSINELNNCPLESNHSYIILDSTTLDVPKFVTGNYVDITQTPPVIKDRISSYEDRPVEKPDDWPSNLPWPPVAGGYRPDGYRGYRPIVIQS